MHAVARRWVVPPGYLYLEVTPASGPRSRIGPREEARPPHDRGDRLLPVHRHQVDPADPLDLPEGLDRLHRDREPLGPRVRRLLDPFHDVRRDDDAGALLVQEP